MSSSLEFSVFGSSNFQFQEASAVAFMPAAPRKPRVYIKNDLGGLPGQVSRIVFEEMQQIRRKNYQAKKRYEGILKREIFRFEETTKKRVEGKVGKEKALEMGSRIDAIVKVHLALVGKRDFSEVAASLKQEMEEMIQKEEVSMYCQRRKSSFEMLGASSKCLDQVAEKYTKLVGQVEYKQLQEKLKKDIEIILQTHLVNCFLNVPGTDFKGKK